MAENLELCTERNRIDRERERKKEREREQIGLLIIYKTELPGTFI